jgi:pimeloyl-ACP methyl ester carboxylesterase
MSVSASPDYQELAPAWPGEWVEVGSQPMSVRHAPAAVPGTESAVFVHGLGGGSASWTDLMDLMRERFDCWAPDLPGFGQSPPPPAGGHTAAYGVESQARAVAGLIEQTSRAPVHLFGNSSGGMVATRVAAGRPDLVGTLTLISPALPDLRPRAAVAGLLAPLVPGLGELGMRRASARTPTELARQALEGLFGDPSRIHPQRLAETAEEIRVAAEAPHAREAYLGALRGAVREYLRPGQSRLWRLAGRVRAPTLAIYGGTDPIVDARAAARAVRTYPDARVVIVAGVGHLAQLEVPRLVERQFRAMLDADGG